MKPMSLLRGIFDFLFFFCLTGRIEGWSVFQSRPYHVSPQTLSVKLTTSRHSTICLAAKDALQDDDDDDDEAKFLELGKEITNAYGPLGIVTAGYTEEHLDIIIDACEAAISAHQRKLAEDQGTQDFVIPPPHLPVAILGKSDLKRTFGEVLSELGDRDCVLPADGDELLLAGNEADKKPRFSYLKYPLILYSGFEIPALQLSLRYMEQMGTRLPMQPMVAMAVPRAMNKAVSQLLEELEGDHAEVTKQSNA